MNVGQLIKVVGPVADARLSIGKRHERKIGRAAHFEHGEIRFGIDPDDFAGIALAIDGLDLHASGVIDDVVVSQDVPVGRDEETRSLSLHNSRNRAQLRLTELPEELLEGRG